MSIDIVRERLNSYNCQSVQEEENAIREIAQEVVLGGLSRAGFFKSAAFQGGTCLRILYRMERFSEDLDFILTEPHEQFQLKQYLEKMNVELETYGFNFNIKDRKNMDRVVQKHFVKDDSLVKLLQFDYLKPGKDTRSIKIKIEVDTNPPDKSTFEIKYHDFPFPYEIAAQDLPSLFASKSHALLCREYVKGRDWYDFIWYVSRNVSINYEHLTSAVDQLGPWKGKGIKVDKSWYLSEMKKRINRIDIQAVKNDVKRFVKPHDIPSVDIWCHDFFLDRLDKFGNI
jgi:predicted nucleotidyltransferase component of viral defense system